MGVVKYYDRDQGKVITVTPETPLPTGSAGSGGGGGKTWQGVGNILQGQVEQGQEKLIDLSAEGATAIWIQAPPDNPVPLLVGNISGFEGAWVMPGSSEWFYYPKLYITHSASDSQGIAYQAVMYG